MSRIYITDIQSSCLLSSTFVTDTPVSEDYRESQAAKSRAAKRRIARPGPLAVLILLALVLSFLTFVCPAFAQSGPVPAERYYRGERLLERGELNLARTFYREMLRNSIKIGNSQWLDSICYYTKLGECYYYRGELGDALDCYNTALDITLAYPNWLNRVKYLTPSMSRQGKPPVPWGPGNRGEVPLGLLAEKAGIILGDDVTEERLRQGGAMSNLRQIEINPLEILRCIAQSLRRRNEILGPLAPFDPRSDQLVQLFSKRSVGPNHWSIVWLDTLFGLSLQGVGKIAESQDVLKDSLLASGQYDHMLTPTVLLEMGRLLLAAEKAEEASEYFFEASLSAFHFKDSLIVEESLRYYAAARKVFALGKDDPVLETAFQWAKGQKNLTVLQLSLSEEIAENLVINRNFQAAGHGLQLVTNLMGNRGLDTGRFADRARYLSALLNYSAGKVADGDSDLAAVVAGTQEHSPWLYQLKRLEDGLKSGGLGSADQLNPRTASELYAWLLREPTHTDWSAFPMDAMTASISIPLEVFERWFSVLATRDLKEESFLVAERIRREHFYTAQPMGARLFSLRYLLEAREDLLESDARMNRQNILAAFPEYDAQSKKTQELLLALNSLPVVPDQDEQQRQQKNILSQLQEVSAVQESQLHYIAASRLRIPIVFPPQRTVQEIQKQLGDETTLLSFIVVDQMVYGFLIAPNVLDSWTVGPLTPLSAKISEFLRVIGNIEGNRAITVKDMEEKDWKTPGKQLMQILLGDPNGGGARFSVAFKHLVVVPDLVLWYLPFEALCVPNGGETTPLISMPDVTVRYAPTASLAVSTRRPAALLADTTIVSGEIMAKSDPEVQEEAVARLQAICGKSTLFEEGSLNVASQVFLPRLQQYIALKEISPVRDPVNWNALATVKSSPDTVMSWTLLPWGGPQLVVLPGFRSSAENSLKSGGTGDEFFFPLLAMKSTGVQTILISRWRTGGRAAFDLVENFMSKLKEDSAEMAWKNSVAACGETLLNVKEEPRIRKPGQKDTIPNQTHPFFWSAFMLVDPGQPPREPHAEPGETSENASTDTPANDAADANKTQQATNQETDDGPPTDETTGADSSQAAGVQPVIRVDDPDQEEKSGDNNKDNNTGQDADAKPQGTSDAKPKPVTTGPAPVSDEDLEEADEEADDFFRPKR
ncbi:MAG: hypothetical protein Q4G68_02370 [Planctomycetia bacterium]|nr:hypothetical protein [Planctomycetia bacterium]